MNLSGQTVGKILIRGRLGQGAMGDVYEGFHRKLKRPVAVKTIIKDKRIKPITQARFLREARLLSRLDHPNICKIYDYLEDESFDLLVLELIKGRRLKEVVNDEMEFSERLRIALQLAEAVAAAHAEGVVHRDLKPDNIMLTDDGEVKVLDFGLSRTEGGAQHLTIHGSLDTHETEGLDVLQTRQGILMGTLSYMSPEQARGEQATSASDMYSLGLIFQELFTGEGPYEANLPFATQLRLAASGETRPIKGLDDQLSQLIGRLKSLVPEARPGATDLVDHLRRIAERPMRHRRRLVRNLAVAALAFFALVMTWQAMRIKSEAERANREATRASRAAANANNVADFLVQLFEQMDPDRVRGGSIPARELLDRGAQRIESLKGDSLARARIMFTIGKLYRKLGIYESAEPLLRDALALREAEPDISLELADSQLEMARLNVDLDRTNEALKLADQSLKTRTSLLGPDHVSIAEVLLVKSATYLTLNDYIKAETFARQALALRSRYLPAEDPDIGIALSLLGDILDVKGDNEESIEVLQKAVAILEKSERRNELIQALDNLAQQYSQRFEFDNASKLYNRALDLAMKYLGPEHPKVGNLYNNIAVLYDNQSMVAEALPYYQKALTIWEKAYGEEHSRVIQALANMAASYTELGNPRKALAMLNRAMDLQSKLFGADSGIQAFHLLLKARAEAELGQFDKASISVAKAIDIQRKNSQVEVELIAVNMELLGGHLTKLNRLSDAESLFRNALGIWQGRNEKAWYNIIHDLRSLAEILRRTNREDEAGRMEERAHELEKQIEVDKDT